MHTHERDCIGLYSLAVESESRGKTRIVVRGGERGDGRSLAELVATSAWVDRAKHPEGGAQARGSADGQCTHRSGGPSRRCSAAAHAVRGRTATVDRGGLLKSRPRRSVRGAACSSYTHRPSSPMPDATQRKSESRFAGSASYPVLTGVYVCV